MEKDAAGEKAGNAILVDNAVEHLLKALGQPLSSRNCERVVPLEFESAVKQCQCNPKHRTFQSASSSLERCSLFRPSDFLRPFSRSRAK